MNCVQCSFFFGRELKNILQNTKDVNKNIEVKTDGTENHSKGRQYGKYTVIASFSGDNSITDLMNCLIERKASLKY